MDRLTLIEVIAAGLREANRRLAGGSPPIAESRIFEVAGTVADEIIRQIGLRSLRTGATGPEGGTMPGGPWSGSG